MLRRCHEHEDGPNGLVRRTAATRLGVEATRLETAGRRGDPPHLRRDLPPCARQPTATCRPSERPTPPLACGTTRRGHHPGVVARALAGPGKKAADEGRTVVWVDQSGFYLLPMAVRTWAPHGQTPLTHDHLAAISGITPDACLCRHRSWPTTLRTSYVSCACCCARSMASCSSSGMARRSIVPGFMFS